MDYQKRQRQELYNIASLRKSSGVILMLSAVIIFIAVFYRLQVNLYEGLHMTIHDIQMSNQVLYNTLHGRFLENNFAIGHIDIWANGVPHSIFEHHMYLILLLILPLYALSPDVYILFFLQALATGFGGLAIYLIAKHVSDSNFVSVCLGISYLLYPTIQGMTLNNFLFGFHPDILFATFLLFAFYYSLKNKSRLIVVFVILAFLCGEHLSLTIVAFGLYLILFQKKQRSLGIVVAGVSVTWFALSILVIIPHFRGAPPRYVSQALSTGSNMQLDLLPALLLTTLYTKYLFLPLAFTFLLNIPSLLIAVPGFMLNLASRYTGYSMGYAPFSWRMAQLSPFIFLSAALGISQFYRRLQLKNRPHLGYIVTLLVLMGTLSSSFIFGPTPWSRKTSKEQYAPLSNSEMHILSKFKAMINPEDSLSADPFWGSQFTSRQIIHPFPIGWQKDDWVLIVPKSQPHPRSDKTIQAWEDVRKSCLHHLVLDEGSVELYQRIDVSNCQ